MKAKFFLLGILSLTLLLSQSARAGNSSKAPLLTVTKTNSCKEIVNAYCNKLKEGECEPFFWPNDKGTLVPRQERRIAKLRSLAPTVLAVAKELKVNPQHLMGVLVTMQAKISQGAADELMAGDKAAGIIDDPVTASSKDSGAGVDSGSGKDSGAGVDSGSGKDSGTGVDSGSGKDSGTGVDSGTEKMLGDASHINSSQNIGMVDEGIAQAEEVLAKLEGRPKRTDAEVQQLLFTDARAAIKYAAALVHRNQAAFDAQNIGDTVDLAVAVTLYGLADVDTIAKRVAGRVPPIPHPNSWGYYALCKQPLIDELLLLTE